MAESDPICAGPRLAEIYDLVEGNRDDLGHYLAIAAGLGARGVLDVGCGSRSWITLPGRSHGLNRPVLADRF